MIIGENLPSRVDDKTRAGSFFGIYPEEKVLSINRGGDVDGGVAGGFVYIDVVLFVYRETGRRGRRGLAPHAPRAAQHAAGIPAVQGCDVEKSGHQNGSPQKRSQRFHDSILRNAS